LRFFFGLALPKKVGLFVAIFFMSSRYITQKKRDTQTDKKRISTSIPNAHFCQLRAIEIVFLYPKVI
jgi:hypothetical protein